MPLLLKQTGKTGILLFAVMLFFSPAWAIDYTALSNNELYELKGAIKNAPKTEQETYQKEWQFRVSKMTGEEAQRYTSAHGVSNGGDDSTNDVAKPPFTPGRGYEKHGTGTVILGGIPSGK